MRKLRKIVEKVRKVWPPYFAAARKPAKSKVERPENLKILDSHVRWNMFFCEETGIFLELFMSCEEALIS